MEETVVMEMIWGREQEAVAAKHGGPRGEEAVSQWPKPLSGSSQDWPAE